MLVAQCVCVELWEASMPGEVSMPEVAATPAERGCPQACCTVIAQSENTWGTYGGSLLQRPELARQAPFAVDDSVVSAGAWRMCACV